PLSCPLLRLPEPAAPAAPPVAHQDEQREGGKSDEENILDVADVVTAQHRQQEDDAEHPDAVPGADIDPAPAPRCGRHLGGVDALVVIDLGTGHGDSLRIGLACCTDILAYTVLRRRAGAGCRP